MLARHASTFEMALISIMLYGIFILCTVDYYHTSPTVAECLFEPFISCSLSSNQTAQELYNLGGV